MPSTPTPPEWPLAHVLVVDDEAGMRNFLEKTLASRCGEVHSAADAEAGDELIRHHRFDLLVLDITLPGKSGIAWLRELREQGYAGEVILITAFADLDTAIEALRAGASDFILKPFRVTQILNAVRRGLERAKLQRENWALRHALRQRTPEADGLVGSSIAIKGLQAALQRVAAVDSTVLLAGESGTGKEIAALAIHRQSARRGGPFVPVNCATMSPAHIEQELFGHASGAAPGGGPGRDGLFVYAQGGTLFLDEIGDLPLPLQATLLRVLEDRRIRPVGSEQEIPVDVRVVCATHQDLQGLIREGRFREDLYYRLAEIVVTIPALRAREGDSLLLAQVFLRRFSQDQRRTLAFTEDAMRSIEAYDWPGNVRQLLNAVKRAAIMADGNRVAPADLSIPAVGQVEEAVPGESSLDLRRAREGAERRVVLAALAQSAGNIARTAELLGVSRPTLYDLMSRLAIRQQVD